MYGGRTRLSSPCESAYELQDIERITLLNPPVYSLTNPHYRDFLQFHEYPPVFGIAPGFHTGSRWPLLVMDASDSDSDDCM